MHVFGLASSPSFFKKKKKNLLAYFLMNSFLKHHKFLDTTALYSISTNQ